MFAVLKEQGTTPSTAGTPEETIREQWERLLAAATSPQERDEINDMFGRSIAA